jgi:hypothetical protein
VLSQSKWGRLLSILRRYREILANIYILTPVGDCFWHTVPSWNCLTNVGASDSGMTMQPLVNFHHPFSRKFPPSVSNQDCSCEVYHGSHSDKGHRNKTAASKAEICPPVRAAYLASLSALCFPRTLLVPSAVYDCYSLRGPYRFQ